MGMTAPKPEELRALAAAVSEWSSTDVWPHEDDDCIAVLGQINEDDVKFPVAEINADTYFREGESLALAKFYAAANPAAVLALLDRIAGLEAWQEDVRSNSPLLARLERAEQRVQELQAELVAEAARTAEQKLRADQMSKQHDTQAALNKEAREQQARKSLWREIQAAGNAAMPQLLPGWRLVREETMFELARYIDPPPMQVDGQTKVFQNPEAAKALTLISAAVRRLIHDGHADYFKELMLGKQWVVPQCHCEACDVAANGMRSRMSLCPQCGDKRCPRAAHHNNQCAKTGATN